MKHGRIPRPSRHAAKLPTSDLVRRLTITIVAVVVCGTGAAYLDMEIVRSEYYNRGEALNSLRADLTKTLNELGSSKRALDELQAKEGRLDSLDQQKRVFSEKVSVMERELAAMRTELADTVREVRAKAAGTTLPELRLVNGQVLSGVRLLNVSNSEMSVSHDRGMVRLPAANLPLDLQDRFRFGTLPTETSAPPKPSLAVQSSSAQPAAVTSVAAAHPSPTVNSTDNAQRMQTLNNTVVALRARLLAMETQQRNDSAKTIRRNARTERLYPSTSTQMQYPYQSTKTIDQLEREGKRKIAEETARAAEEAAKNKEMDALRSKISLIEGEIQRIANGY